ncbi:MAG: sulfide-dependent adenosine diphosphate thiazole synthase [Kiritimatiellia bacterium]
MEELISRTIVSAFANKLQDCMSLDAAIVGAGPSGLICAQELASSGHKVAVFEEKLAPGGGIWGGAMLNNEIVVPGDIAGFLENCGIRYSKAEGGLLRADSVETASALIYRAMKLGARIFNSIVVEDVVYKQDRVAGVVINWSPVNRQGMHVDPLVITSKAVLDATGHNAKLTARVASKAGIRLNTPSGGVAGEKPMWAEVGEKATVENTREVYPGLFVAGMAANAVFGSARMGPIFGGMFLSGLRAARLIKNSL